MFVRHDRQIPSRWQSRQQRHGSRSRVAPSLLSTPLLVLLLVVLPALIFTVASGETVRAATVTVAGCQKTDLTNAINAAADGDTIVYVQDCSVSFNSPVTIGKSLTIDATGHTVVMTGNNTDFFNARRLLTVNGGVTVTMKSLTLSNGGSYQFQPGSTQGGAIINNGTLFLMNCRLTGNNVTGSGNPGQGGAIYNTGTVTITNSTLANNLAGGYPGGPTGDAYGGAFYNNGGTATITNSVLSGNNASGIISIANGGAIYTNGGTVNITNSTLSGNSAVSQQNEARGGAIGESNATMNIVNSTVSGNTANGSHASAIGGGIIATGGTINFINSTLTGNTLSAATPNSADGSAMWISNGATINATNTLIGFNSGGRELWPGGLSINKNSLIDGFTFTDPNAGAPVAHGGPAATLAIPTSAPAYQAGDLATCQALTYAGTATPLAVDQRGAPRIVSNTCSIGAYEPGKIPSGVALSANPAAGGAFGTSVTLTAAVSGPLGEPVPDGTNVVTFKDGATTLTTTNVTGGVARFATATLRSGNSVTATYAGAGDYIASPVSAAVSIPISVGVCAVTSATDPSESGKLTLRDAIVGDLAGQCTNNTVTFDATAFPANTPTTITLASSMPTIASAVTVDGAGHQVMIDGGGARQIFTVNSGVAFTVNTLTLSHGLGSPTGGAIVTSGTTTVTNSTLSGNSASDLNGGGGAIVTSGTLNVTGSTFTTNSATGTNSGTGGSILITSGTATITGSSFSGNSATTAGGAIGIDAGTVTLTNDTFSGNSALDGGGIRNNGTITVRNSTFSGNTAGSASGGAGILTNGGAITNTIIAHSTTGLDIALSGGTLTASHNVIDDAATGTGLSDGVNSNSIGHPALLGANGTYGNTMGTQTFPLLPGSPAIDAGDDPTCIASGSGAVVSLDQRGIARPQGAHCDVGAFESQGFTLTATTGDGQSAGVTTVFTTPLGVTVASTHSEPVDGGQVTFAAAAGTNGQAATFTGSPATIAGGGASVTATANTKAGGYAVTASASGAPSATYSLTNIPGAANTLTPSPSTPLSAVISTAFPALAVTVTDSASNPVVDGTSVVFSVTPAGNGASASLGKGEEATTTNGVASVTAIANGTIGGPFTVTATSNGHTATFTLTNIAPALSLTAIAPTNGSIAGGTIVTLTGTGFVAGATVSIGGIACTTVSVTNGTTLTCITGAHAAGAVDVAVTRGNTTKTLANGFTYTASTVTGISPNAGPVAGGTAVTLTGTGFAAGATVKFDGVAATNVVVVNATTITATAPAHAAGVVDVVVMTSGQALSLSHVYTYGATSNPVPDMRPGIDTGGTPNGQPGSRPSGTPSGTAPSNLPGSRP